MILFVGNSLIDNLLSLNLFEEAFKNKDRKAVLSYLLENQGWEIGMLAACNSKVLKKLLDFSCNYQVLGFKKFL